MGVIVIDWVTPKVTTKLKILFKKGQSAEHPSQTWVAQQSMTKYMRMNVMDLFKPTLSCS